MLFRSRLAATILQLSHDRSVGNRFCALSTDGTIYTSTNNGTTWSATGYIPTSKGERGQIAAAFNNVYAATAAGVLKSEDNGSTWANTSVTGIAHSFAWNYAADRLKAGLGNSVVSSAGGDFVGETTLGIGAPAAVYVDRSEEPHV